MTREEMARLILQWEARRDSQGRLKVYRLRPDDGGGTYEVAGINDRYHPVAVRRLKSLIDAGRYDEAETEAALTIASYTDPAASWAGNWRTALFLRDTSFNRGPTGAARILQHALHVPVDGAVGPVTREALRVAEQETPALILRLRASREWYERTHARRDESSPYWRGLVNRWDKVTAAALAA